MRSVLTALMAALCLIALPGGAMAGEDKPVTVRTEQGALRGTLTEDGSALFHSVPFAAPPIGDLRWRAPQPPEPWEGIREALEVPPACAQADLGWNGGDRAKMSEDCLYFSIRTPSVTPEKPLPVVVFIHGGANIGGRGSWGVTGDFHKQGVVFVALHYRLGVLGFMSHKALTAESGHGASGNYGIMDQQAALRWIRSNIANFGGDPERVTILGFSAGSQHVALHMQSPLSQGLFHGGIQQSGTTNFKYKTRDLAAAEEQGELIMEAAGLGRGASATAMRGLDLEVLLKAQRESEIVEKLYWHDIYMPPTVDGYVITEDPKAALSKPTSFSVPVIMGSNRQEGAFGELEDLEGDIRGAYGDKGDAALALYKQEADPRFGDANAQFQTDLVFRCPMVQAAKAGAKAGGVVWQYEFDYDGPNGVSHSSEVQFVVGHTKPAHGPLPLQTYWANFARTGDPNGEGLTPWVRHTPEGEGYLVFTNEGPKVGLHLRKPLCDWLD